CWHMPRGTAMLWELEIQPKGTDNERQRIVAEYDLLTHSQRGISLVHRATRGFLLEGENLPRAAVDRLCHELLVDPLCESSLITELPEPRGGSHHGTSTLRARFDIVTVLLKPGVMDPVAGSVVDAARDLDIPLREARTFRRYYIAPFASEPGALMARGDDPGFRGIVSNVLGN